MTYPIHIIGIDPSERSCGIAVISGKRTLFSTSIDLWDLDARNKVLMYLESMLGRVKELPIIACEVTVGGPKTAFSSTSVNRASGLAIALVLDAANIALTHLSKVQDNPRIMMERVNYVVPASWRKAAFGKVEKGLSRSIWKKRAIARAHELFSDLPEKINSDEAEAILIAYATQCALQYEKEEE